MADTRQRGPWTDDNTSPPRLCIVDDVPEVAHAFADVLEGQFEGCVCEIALDGEAGLARIDSHVDLVLLNYRMPGLDGIEVGERLRDRGYDGVLIYQSGVGPFFELHDSPFDDVLIKPASRQDLTGVVEKWT